MFAWLTLVHHVQGIELEVVTFVKPGADKVIEPKARSPGECQGVDHELRDGLFPHRVWFVVENMDPTVADLEKINVARQRGLRGEGNDKAQLPLQVGDVLWRKVERH